MHSSISSSDWGKTWLLSIVLIFVMLCTWECVLRTGGHRPTVCDSACLWSYWRAQAVGDKIVVVLGDSRPLLGWSRDACERMLPGYRSIQLAVDGRPSPMVPLRDLAGDEAFCGIVVVGMSERGFERQRWEDQSGVVSYARTAYRMNARINSRISVWLHDRITLLDPRLKIDSLIGSVAKTRALPLPCYIRMGPDRTYYADYTMPDWHRIAPMIGCWYDGPLTPKSSEQWLVDATAMEPSIRRIQARGGRVIFVRFPSSGKTWEIETTAYPRERYWDRFAAQTSALCVHWLDHSELARFPCPDGSHLDHHDAGAFTAALINILVQTGDRMDQGN